MAKSCWLYYMRIPNNWIQIHSRLSGYHLTIIQISSESFSERSPALPTKPNIERVGILGHPNRASYVSKAELFNENLKIKLCRGHICVVDLKDKDQTCKMNYWYNWLYFLIEFGCSLNSYCLNSNWFQKLCLIISSQITISWWHILLFKVDRSDQRESYWKNLIIWIGTTIKKNYSSMCQNLKERALHESKLQDWQMRINLQQLIMFLPSKQETLCIDRRNFCSKSSLNY